MKMKKNGIDGKKFKRFFFFGIENKREMIEGILYFSYQKVYQKHQSGEREWRETLKKQIENEILQEAIGPYQQFYRFVILNDEPKTKDEIMSQMSIEKEELKQQLEQEIQLLKAEKKILDTNAGLFFARERENLLDSKPYYIYGKGIQGEEAWTKQVYGILENLEKLEQQDKEEYQGYFWLAKLARAINRHNREEAEMIREQMRQREGERDEI